MRNEAERSLVALEPGMQTALGQAWASIRGGSLGIGAAAYEVDGTFVASGRNRLLETDPGDDVLAGSSLAHAELNVLAKLGYRRHDALRLFTTLQPCVQCLGAIRLSTVATVVVLAPDPLFRGVERMRELTPFLGRNWPAVEQLPITPWSAFALLYPTRHSLDHPTLGPVWTQALPTTAEVARGRPPSGTPNRCSMRLHCSGTSSSCASPRSPPSRQHDDGCSRTGLRGLDVGGLQSARWRSRTISVNSR